MLYGQANKGELKKLFSKVKNNVKIASASEGHRLQEAPVPSVAPQIVQLQTDSQVSLRSSSDSEIVTRAAATVEAAQRRVHRTTDSIRRQTKRELEQEKEIDSKYKKARDIKEHYFGNREMTVDSTPVVDYTTLLLYVLRKLVPLKYVTELFQASKFILSENQESIIYEENSIKQLQLSQRTLRNRNQ
ncbi:unnamed protein product [Rotaria socialis]|uniref:Uncharacterized protein n=1 Tax=Rotaria socialis TaxID=392032 RepID=A0A820STJ0_9BILA|nr:unnamed protein product [Rotaria socialis]CAF4149606.1 unnamed protein product [Rotaria socialis]CAF4337510.1 unnamed protein product [Rotaria socialis]CAF4459343.1 unnamed protein product [Rotaria socialis]CAF4544385.1 unnamed protein product [Rotaria socialis]